MRFNFNETYSKTIGPLSSLDLYNGRLRDKIADDDAFTIATVDHSRGVITIDQNTPLVWRNDDVRKKYGERFKEAENCPTRAELMQDEGRIQGLDNTFWLLSGGANVWIQNESGEMKMATLRRDQGAPAAAGYLTGPNGLSAEDVNLTMLKETNEELGILISDRSDGEENYTMPVFVDQSNHTGVDDKTISDKLSKAKKVIGSDNISVAFVTMTEQESDKKYDIAGIDRKGKTHTLSEFSGFVCEDSFRSLCMRRNIALSVESFDQIILFDGEKFDRDTGLKTVEEMRSDLTLDDIRKYLDSLEDQPNIQAVPTAGL